MCGIKPFIVFPVTSFYLAIVPGRIRANQFVLDSMFHETFLKKGRLIRTTMRAKPFRKFLSVVCLDTFDRAGESPDQVFQE